MTKQKTTDAILAAKIAKGLTWAKIADAAGLSEVYTTSACLGEDALAKEEAERVGTRLDLKDDVIAELTRPAVKGDSTMNIEKQPDPKGDRVVVTMNGKFLPYRKW